MVGLKNGRTRKNLTQNGEPQRYNCERSRRGRRRLRYPVRFYILVAEHFSATVSNLGGTLIPTAH